jgi:hypothetical protein
LFGHSWYSDLRVGVFRVFRVFCVFRVFRVFCVFCVFRVFRVFRVFLVLGLDLAAISDELHQRGDVGAPGRWNYEVRWVGGSVFGRC